MAFEGTTLSLPESGNASAGVVSLAEPQVELLDMLDKFEANNPIMPLSMSAAPKQSAAGGASESLRGGDNSGKMNDEGDNSGEMNDEQRALEEMFRHRFTEQDSEFQTVCQKPLPPPPCIENWFIRSRRDNWRGHGGGYQGSPRGHRGGGGWQRDGGYRGPRGPPPHQGPPQHWGGRPWQDHQHEGGRWRERGGGWEEQRRDHSRDGDRDRHRHGHSQSDRRDRSPL